MKLAAGNTQTKYNNICIYHLHFDDSSKESGGITMSGASQALDLILMQYGEKYGQYNEWEISYLCEAAERGIYEFGDACHIVFGVRLSEVLYAAIQCGQETNQHAFAYMTNSLDEEASSIAIAFACDIAAACKLLYRLQRRYQCTNIAHSGLLTSSACYFAKASRLKLDPDEVLFAWNRPRK